MISEIISEIIFSEVPSRLSYQRRKHCISVIDNNGRTLTKPEDRLKRWTEHFEQLSSLFYVEKLE